MVPNWRWEDTQLNPFELRVAGWLASHADRWRQDHVSRNMIADRTGIAASTVSKAVAHLVELGIVVLHRGDRGRFVIEFDFAVWETPESTDPPPVATRPVATRPVIGRLTTSDRSPDDHIEEQGEQQGDQPPQPPASGGRRRRSRAAPEPLTPLERADDFDAWWQTYPRRIAKLDAVAAWRVMIGHLPDVDRLISASRALEARVRREHHDDDQWQRFIPYPATWLRRGDYLDDGGHGTPVQVRRPCVLCGVDDPSPARCRGVEIGSIDDVDSECIWRAT